jgi:peptide/nickel transport system substrate-binding protein
MKKSFIALLIAVLLLSACDNAVYIEEPDDTPEPEEILPKTALIIGTTGMTGNFSPFFSTSAGDIDVLNVINVPLVTLDRRGEVVRNAAVGERRVFDGIEYYYEGIADTAIIITEHNTTVLTFRLREDVFFSDGVNMTADDVIFTLNTLLDENYRGRHAAVGFLPVAGLKNYRANASPEIYEKYAEILESGELDSDSGQYELYRECERLAWREHIRAIVEFCVQNYADSAHVIADGDIYNNEWLQVALAMMVWRVADFAVISAPLDSAAVFGNFTSVSGREWDFVNTFPSVNDFYNEFYALYGGDLEEYISREKIGQPWLDNVLERAELHFIRTMAALDEENSGVTDISGIRRISDYEVEVTLAGHIPAAVYAFAFPVVPAHNFNAPLGAGAYKLTGFENGVAALEANEFYFKGTPEVPQIRFVETSPNDLIYGVASGAIDIAAVSATRETLGEVFAYSAAGIKTQEADSGMFGFIGFNAERVGVYGEPMSEESINFRKGIATIMAAYRDISVWSFYEGAARVAEYPVSGVSWAAPRQSDFGYGIAFDTDGDAKSAALEYFAAAGCELNAAGTAIMELPEDISGNYEVYVVGFGTGRHPSFLLLTMAAETLRTVGINIDIIDVSSQGEMYEAVINGRADMWAAAWQGEVQPNTNKTFRSGGAENFFRLSDEMIDQRIDLAGSSLNLEFYRNAFDAVMDSAVCIPVYQRQMYFIFSSEIDYNTIEANLTAHYGWAEILWQIRIGG